jgi:SPP1 gp7 family putative phage head morphogenesis protein
MTPKQLAQLIREFLLEAEKRSAFNLLGEFDDMKKELEEFLRARGVDLSNIDDILSEVERQIETRVVRFSSLIGDAQRHVVRQTAKVLNLYLKTSIFRSDTQATQKLIGRTQTGESLVKIFERLKEPAREAAKKALIDGFADGKGAAAIASDLKAASDMPYARALVISRNETVMAYRHASTEFYKEAGIPKYRFMAVLDPRTCAVCWRLHGTIWPVNTKPHIHTQCRCTVIPVLKSDGETKTGVELFAGLEPGFQKQILGPKRYELFQQGGTLESFIDAKHSKEYGPTYFVKPLSP